MEIQATWSHILRIWWALFWRTILAVLGAALAGFVLGFLIGAVLGYFGVEPRVIQFVAGLIGLPIGLLAGLIPLKLVIGKDFGRFRLVILSNEPSPGS